MNELQMDFFQQIPVEIISIIFQELVPPSLDAAGQDESYELVSPNPTQTPWNLAAVSGRWRDIAFSCHFLWTIFSVRFDLASDLGPRALRLVRAALERAGRRAPLHVGLYSSDGENAESISTGRAQIMLDILASHHAQWTTTDLAMWTDDLGVSQWANTLSGIYFNNLSTLKVDLNYWNTNGAYLNAFRECPRLRSVIIVMDEGGFLPTIDLPWEGVQSLSVGNIDCELHHSSSLRPALRLLSQCSALHELHWEPSLSESHILGDTVFLPLLKRLVVRTGYICHHIVAPSLRKLVITEANYSEVDLHTYSFVKHMLDRSGSKASLTTFEIRGAMHRAFLFDILAEMENLAHLTLGVESDPSLSTGVAVLEESHNLDFVKHGSINVILTLLQAHTFLPRLESLDIVVSIAKGCRIPILFTARFARAMIFRWENALHPFWRLHITVPRTEYGDMMTACTRWWRDLVDDGMDLRIDVLEAERDDVPDVQ